MKKNISVQAPRARFHHASILSSFLFLSFLFAAGGAGAETRDYSPVVFSYAWDSGVSVWLMGAFKEGKWYEHTALPIMVNGRAITPEEGVELLEPVPCSTPLVRGGARLAFYSAEGRKIGAGTVMGTQYSTSAASAETFIDVEMEMGTGKELKMPPGVMSIGVEDGWNAVSAPTRRTVEKGNIVFVFEPSEPSKKLSVTFSPGLDEAGEKVYGGLLAWGEKSLKLTDAYVEEEEQLAGFFIDLNGDGQVEFVLHSQSIGGFVTAFELRLDRDDPSATEVLSLDLGD
ncbi:MAG: hypothetical protein LBQ42_13425 [Synergistaceae bacterium]|jgi:hypothetical protein|nr:hypothetical protein [Synergistaceae bacterium]